VLRFRFQTKNLATVCFVELFDELVKKVGIFIFLSFRRKPESFEFNEFWMPDQVRHDGFETLYETVPFA